MGIALLTLHWRYRFFALAGSISLIASAVVVANHPGVQSLFVSIPVADRLRATTLPAGSLAVAAATVSAVMLVALNPLFRPRSRRIDDVVILTVRRVVLLTLTLAAIGYFDYSYRLPRTTLMLTGALLLVVLPAWFAALKSRLQDGEETAIIIGDDLRRFSQIHELAECRVIGYVSPVPSPSAPGGNALMTDGGDQVTTGGRRLPVMPPDATLDLERLGGLSRLESTLVNYGPDVAILSFMQPDRQEFFGTLQTCHRQGVTAKIPSDHESVDSVFARDGVDGEELTTIDLVPWDLQDVAMKRMFDVAFAAVGLILLAPVVFAVIVGIKVDDGGPVLYSQRRTSWFGDTYSIYKLRTMVPGAEDETGAVVSPSDAGEPDPRITRFGRILRPTHLDEIPQLWSILVGDMSVVGPRPERPAMEEELEGNEFTWRKRWFVKPGLTGLAQVNGVTGAQPETKLHYDVRYIQQQSFRFDLRIVARQIGQVVADVATLVRDRLGR